MSTPGLPRRRSATPWADVDLPRLAASAVLTLWIAGALFALFVSGPAARNAAELQALEEIALENRAACEKLGIRAGTREHEACWDVLNEIRASQDRRRADEMRGPF